MSVTFCHMLFLILYMFFVMLSSYVICFYHSTYVVLPDHFATWQLYVVCCMFWTFPSLYFFVCKIKTSYFLYMLFSPLKEYPLSSIIESNNIIFTTAWRYHLYVYFLQEQSDSVGVEASINNCSSYFRYHGNTTYNIQNLIFKVIHPWHHPVLPQNLEQHLKILPKLLLLLFKLLFLQNLFSLNLPVI